MLLILLSWIYIFATSLTFGVATQRALKVNSLQPIITLCFGLFSITIFSSIWAIFSGISQWFYLSFFLITILLFIGHKNHVFEALKQLRNQFASLLLYFKVLLFVLLILLLAKCATAPFLIDNETYYIQTIKWLNEYGFTKGLVNLHPFLGQTSGWHVLQSTFNFSFIYNNLNDISGFMLLLGNYYAIFKLNHYIKASEKNRTDLIIGLFPVFNVFLFQFISSPSPDIAIYVLALIIFSEFISCYKSYSKQSFYTVVLLSLFAIFIKLTGLFFIFLAFVLYKRYYIFTRSATLKLVIISTITFGLFGIKNLIISGNLLYPIVGLESLKTSWSLPNTIANYLSQYERAASYGLTLETYNNASVLQILKSWLLQINLDGLFNISMVFLIAISPFFIKKLKSRNAFFILYGLAILFVIFLFFFTPQYRFYFPFLMVLLLIVVSFIINKENIIKLIVSASTVLVIIPLIFQLNASAVTNTKMYESTNTFKLNYILEPHSNSKYKNDFKPLKIGNTTINALTNGSGFIWETGDAPLPALSVEQMNYLKTYFGVIPQQNSKHLKDGFYSKSIKNE